MRISLVGPRKMKWPFGKTYDVECPDGTTKTVYRDVDKAFPFLIQGLRGKADANVSLKGIKAKVGTEYVPLVQGLFLELNEQNQSLMLSFKAAYFVYKNDPCNYSSYFQDQVKKLLEDQSVLRRTKMQFHALIALAELDSDNREEIITVFKDIVGQLGGPSSAEVASLEIAEARSVSKDWIKGDQDE